SAERRAAPWLRPRLQGGQGGDRGRGGGARRVRGSRARVPGRVGRAVPALRGRADRAVRRGGGAHSSPDDGARVSRGRDGPARSAGRSDLAWGPGTPAV